jgi:hypothetical protein
MIHVDAPFKIADYKRLTDIEQLPPVIKTWITNAEAHEKVLLDHSIPLADKYNYIEKNSGFWRSKRLIKWLIGISHNKCWYSEAKFAGDSVELEHWRPKKATHDFKKNKIHDGYYWLAFNLTNYRISKGKLNRIKGNFFPLLDETTRAGSCLVPHIAERPFFLDPISPSDHQCLSFNDIGEAIFNAGILTPKAEERTLTTIKYFGLNTDSLLKERQLLWSTVRQHYSDYIKHIKLANDGCPVSLSMADTFAHEIHYLIHETSAFSSTARAALKTLREETAYAFAMSTGKPRPLNKSKT